MIYDDYQRNVTAKTAGKFRATIKELSQLPKNEIANLKRHQNRIRAMRLQAEELEAEMAYYDLIKSGQIEIKVTSISDLGKNLVNARIRSGMDQATFAKRLKLGKDQIVTNEVNQYAMTAIDEIRNAAKIFNVEIPEDVIPSHFNGKISGILSKLKKAGFDRKFVLSRLILPLGLEKVANQSGTTLDKYTLGLYTHLNHVFGWTWDQLTGSSELVAPIANSASAKFKVESSRSPDKINVYSTYAHYIANVASEAAKTLVKRDIPTNAISIRKEIIDAYGVINFENTLNYAWDCGVIVIPLNDNGSFHGVCIRVQSRNVIILNPKNLYESTWLFDLLHELSHAGQEPDETSFDEIEAVVTSHERRTSKEELDANKFANAVILRKDAFNLFNQCIEQSNGKLNLLKKVIPLVAEKNNVMADALANYVAHEAKTNTQFKYSDLLAIAESLQMKKVDPYEVAIDIFFDRLPFTIKDGIDQDLLLQALEDA